MTLWPSARSSGARSVRSEAADRLPSPARQAAAGVLPRHDRRRRVQDDRRRDHLEGGDRQVLRRHDRRRSRSASRTLTSCTSARANHRFAATSRTATGCSRAPTPARRGRTSASGTRGRSRGCAIDPTNPDIVYVRRPGPRVGAERRARRVQDHRRRQDLAQGAVPERFDWRHRSRDRSEEPADTLRGVLAGLSQPWKLVSGGAGSGIFKSTDAGEHWTEITRNPGLPQGDHRQHRNHCSPAKRSDVCGRSSKPIPAVYSAPTTPARRGRKLNDEPQVCGSARGTTRASSPIRKTRTAST